MKNLLFCFFLVVSCSAQSEVGGVFPEEPSPTEKLWLDMLAQNQWKTDHGAHHIIQEICYNVVYDSKFQTGVQVEIKSDGSFTMPSKIYAHFSIYSVGDEGDWAVYKAIIEDKTKYISLGIREETKGVIFTSLESYDTPQEAADYGNPRPAFRFFDILTR
ncbi:MAG: hypothetical protein ACRC0X_06495 [Brevinema sp.]